MDDKESKDMKDSYVLGVLKRRIYHGKEHDTKLDDLKIASREILDYYDKVIESSVHIAQQQILRELKDKAEDYERWIGGSQAIGHAVRVEAVPLSVIQHRLDEINKKGGA